MRFRTNDTIAVWDLLLVHPLDRPGVHLDLAFADELRRAHADVEAAEPQETNKSERARRPTNFAHAEGN